MLLIESPRPYLYYFLFILSCIIEKEGLMTHSNANFMITLANEAWPMEPNTNSLLHPTLLSCDHPFPNGLRFLKRDLLGKYNPSLWALVYLCVFQFDALSWKKGFLVKHHDKKRLNVKFQFLLISHSVLVKISLNFMIILFI